MRLLWIFLSLIAVTWLYTKSKSKPDRATSQVAGLPPGAAGRLVGPGTFTYEVRGEFAYQDELWAVAGTEPKEAFEKSVTSTLIYEDKNEHDPMAVCVEIDGYRVDYLSREDARSYREQLKAKGAAGVTLTCAGKITTTFNDIDEEWQFEVWLDLPVNE